MNVQIIEVDTHEQIDAIIKKASNKDMPLRKNGWQFTWKSLYKTEGTEFYKLTKLKTPDILEGLLMFSVMNEEMLYMNNIEIAPHNFGAKGSYDDVAACLIAFACLKSFELGKNHYKGYTTFDSKTELIKLYQEKYGATLAVGQRMFIAPEIGLQLIEKHLNLKL